MATQIRRGSNYNGTPSYNHGYCNGVAGIAINAPIIESWRAASSDVTFRDGFE